LKSWILYLLEHSGPVQGLPFSYLQLETSSTRHTHTHTTYPNHPVHCCRHHSHANVTEIVSKMSHLAFLYAIHRISVSWGGITKQQTEPAEQCPDERCYHKTSDGASSTSLYKQWHSLL